MIAWVYVRKSNEQKVDAELKSVEHQRERAKAFAASKGWTITRVFEDDALSGAIADRPAVLALRAALHERPRPDVLICADASRLGREQAATLALQKLISDAGVRIVYYETGREPDLKTAIGKFTTNAENFAAEQYREMVREKTRSTLRGRAEKGIVASGRVLGYRNVGEAKARRREVDPEQKKLVIRIFEMATSGMGFVLIAKTLNTEGVKNPTGQDRERSTKRNDYWAPSGIRAVLHRRLYLGEVVYGKTRNEWDDTGRSKIRATEAPVSFKDESLRIISDELWQRAHARMSATSAVYLQRTNGKLHGKPLAGLARKYRLSGHLRCGHCGSTLQPNPSSGKRGKVSIRYVCAGRRTRPGAECPFERGVPEAALSEAVIEALREDFLDSEVLQDLIHEQQARWQAAPDQYEAQRRQITDRIAKLDTELARAADAFFADPAPETIRKAIEQREAERRDLQAKLAQLRPRKTIDPEHLEQRIADFVDTLVSDLGQTPAKTQKTLSRLLNKPIVVYYDGPGAWHADIEASFAKLGGQLDEGQTDVKTTVRVGGAAVDDVWCPRGDSNTRHAV